MDAHLHTHVAFHLTGRTFSADLETIDELDLLPALLGRYRDLAALRYDFPLVLVRPAEGESFVQPLSAIFDAAVRNAAGDEPDDRLASHARRLEREIRALAAAGDGGPLSVLWETAAAHVGAGADAAFGESLDRLHAALAVDGDVVDCDASLPSEFITHAWSLAYEAKARAFRERVSSALLKLSEILRADFARSASGRAPRNLQASVGAAYEDVFDFDALSAVLDQSGCETTLTEARRRRIDALISTLENQQLYPAASDSLARRRSAPGAFVFDSCTLALAAYRERAARVASLSNALAVADLEVRGEYRESHDALFTETIAGRQWLDPDDLAQFPDYLVRLNASDVTPTEQAALMDMLALRLPVKILLQTDDLLDEPATLHGQLGLSLRSRQLAYMAMGLNDAFVLQTPASHLCRFADAVTAGLRFRGPALFSVFSGAPGVTDVPAYLTAAAAMESRAFPAFTFDPSAGPDWASRLSLAGNPQIDADWPAHTLTYEGDGHEEARDDVAFTFADFVACDPRHARHFARVPRHAWQDHLASVPDALAAGAWMRDRVPSLWMIDPADVLHKVIVGDPVMREARRCRDMWRSLRDLAKPAAVAETRIPEPSVDHPADAAHASEPAAIPSASAAAIVDGAGSDDPYIETPRCSTCNECTRINNRMFAYNGDQQAFIADVNAGTYAQLVEAAESCQVSIIHPGKPRNPNEPGLEELVGRAAPFM